MMAVITVTSERLLMKSSPVTLANMGYLEPPATAHSLHPYLISGIPNSDSSLPGPWLRRDTWYVVDAVVV